MKTHTTRFTKMHGLGNDFVVIDATRQPFLREQINIPQLANRHLGIGFDQLLIIEPSTTANFFVRIFNADGSEAEQCGNGLRCVARFVHEEGLHSQPELTIETKSGVYSIAISDYDHIRVTMGVPTVIEKLITLNNNDVSIISVGNPHAILKVTSFDTISLPAKALEISSDQRFQHGVNVGFMQIINQNHILLRTIERGAGETLACGSNACAATAAGIANQWLQSQVKVEFRHGSLAIDWNETANALNMTGPAKNVYSGMLNV